MGISIQYRGSINSTKTIYAFIKEVADIMDTMNWDYDILDQKWRAIPTAHFEHVDEEGIKIVGNTCLKGIQFVPHPKCEPVWLFFTSAGFMSTPFHVALDAEELYPERKVWITTLTHYAGPDVHIAILNLFKHLKRTYIHDLEVHDEGGYWASGDRLALVRRIEHLDKMMNLSDEALMKMMKEKEEKDKNR